MGWLNTDNVERQLARCPGSVLEMMRNSSQHASSDTCTNTAAAVVAENK